MLGRQSHIISLWHLRYVRKSCSYGIRMNASGSICIYLQFFFQSFAELAHRPLLVDLTIEDQSRLKVIYGSAEGFHAVDLDSATVYDIYLPKHVSFFYLFIYGIHHLSRRNISLT